MNKKQAYVFGSIVIMLTGLAMLSHEMDTIVPLGVGLTVLGILGVLLGPLLFSFD